MMINDVELVELVELVDSEQRGAVNLGFNPESGLGLGWV